VNDPVREKVRHLAGIGLRQDDIAKIIGCSPKTLRKRLRGDLDRGVAEANATVSGYLFAFAKAGNVTAQIFWLKVRAHWREKTVPDHPVPGSDAEANSPVVLVLPDNSRDPELTQLLRDAQEKYFARKPRRQPPEMRSQLERDPCRPKLPWALSRGVVVTRFLATRERPPRRPACDVCRHRPRQRSPGSPDH
jgi:hypothetical protein